jgi:hypothetical protein
MVLAAPLSLNAPLEIYSPEWWLKRLLVKLRQRKAICDEYHGFYEGTQPLAFASDKFREVFGRRYSRLPANFMPLVVDAERERLIVQGFRFGPRTENDKGIWKIWQANQLDAESQIAHEIALSKGAAYTLVEPTADGPLITIEDPTETIVETAAGNRRLRVAALKVWSDDDGYLRATLYLPDLIYKYQSIQRKQDNESWSWETTTWQPYVPEGEDWPGRNDLGVVPVIPLLNRPRRDGSGRSEIAPVMGNQNAINKLRFDALVASEFVAFRQRWATNIDVPVDPDTGKEIAPFRPGVDNLWVARRPTPDEVADYGDKFPQPAFGDFAASDLKPYIDMIESEIGEMASISKTPYYYLFGPGNSNPPSAEQTKSSEAPLIRKVGAQAVHFGEGWEETMRVALIASNQRSKARTDGETIWADPETRNEATRTDTLVKLKTLGIPDEVLWELAGLSPQQIERIKAIKVAEQPAEPPPNQPPAIPAPGAVTPLTGIGG